MKPKKSKSPAAPPVTRDEAGRVQPGSQLALGNKGGGRPANEAKKAAEDFFRGFVPAAEQRLTLLINNPDPAVSLRAVQLVFAYVHGRPRQTLELVGEGSDVLDVIIKAQADTAKEAAEAAIAAAKRKEPKK